MANYAEKLSKEEARLNWEKPANKLWHEIRAFNPWPVSYFEHQGQTIKVWQAEVSKEKTSQLPGTIVKATKDGIEVATTDGTLILKNLQLPGKKPLAAADILNGRSEWFVQGTKLIADGVNVQ